MGAKEIALTQQVKNDVSGLDVKADLVPRHKPVEMTIPSIDNNVDPTDLSSAMTYKDLGLVVAYRNTSGVIAILLAKNDGTWIHNDTSLTNSDGILLVRVLETGGTYRDVIVHNNDLNGNQTYDYTPSTNTVGALIVDSTTSTGFGGYVKYSHTLQTLVANTGSGTWKKFIDGAWVSAIEADYTDPTNSLNSTFNGVNLATAQTRVAFETATSGATTDAPTSVKYAYSLQAGGMYSSGMYSTLSFTAVCGNSLAIGTVQTPIDAPVAANQHGFGFSGRVSGKIMGISDKVAIILGCGITNNWFPIIYNYNEGV